MRQDRIEILESIDFDWLGRGKACTNDDLWEETFQDLVQYKMKNGDTLVPQNYITEEGRALGKWVSKQRENYNNGKMKQYRVDQLNEIGFEWWSADHKPPLSHRSRRASKDIYK